MEIRKIALMLFLLFAIPTSLLIFTYTTGGVWTKEILYPYAVVAGIASGVYLGFTLKSHYFWQDGWVLDWIKPSGILSLLAIVASLFVNNVDISGIVSGLMLFTTIGTTAYFHKKYDDGYQAALYDAECHRYRDYMDYEHLSQDDKDLIDNMLTKLSLNSVHVMNAICAETSKYLTEDETLFECLHFHKK